jgi:hypothetical protein
MAYKVEYAVVGFICGMSIPYPTSTNSGLEHHLMRKVTYKVAKCDGSWVYQAHGGHSERFRTRREARTAAKLAASEQAIAAGSAQIAYEAGKVCRHNTVDIGRAQDATTPEPRADQGSTDRA